MPVEEAKYHMKRCVDSGLWVPNAADLAEEQSSPDSDKSETTNDTSSECKKSDTTNEEPIYTGVSSEELD